jgi:hypothetical protein
VPAGAEKPSDAPPNWEVPKVTVVDTPFTTTVASTGEGGKPPPVNMEARAPPQVEPDTPMAPDALNKFTQ